MAGSSWLLRLGSALLAVTALRFEDEHNASNETEEPHDRAEHIMKQWGLTEEEFDEILNDITDEVFADDEDEEEPKTKDTNQVPDQDQDDKACRFSVSSPNVADWLQAAKDAPNSACQDFGPRFGSWGRRSCPSSLAEIAADLLAGADAASGGKSGTAPLISQKFAVKMIEESEHRQLRRLLAKLRGSRRHTFLVPTCRSLVFNVKGGLRYLQVAVNMRLRGAEDEPWNKLFDLKGNWQYTNRMAKSDAKVYKDGNFHNLFPKGIDLQQVSFAGGQDTGDVHVGKAASSLVAKTLHEDSKILASLGIMDYSLLLDMVEFKGNADLPLLNMDKPWAFAFAFAAPNGGREVVLAMSLGIIDYLMNEEDRGALNKFMSGVTFSACEVSDIDPIPAAPYWIRFARMVGVVHSYETHGKCVSCLKEAPGKGFTYFHNDWSYQKSKEICTPGQNRVK